MSVETFAIWFGIVTGFIGVIAAVLQFGWDRILKVAALLLVIAVCVGIVGAGILTVTKKNDTTPSGTPSIRATITNTPEQDMGVPGFTVRREASLLKFKFPAGADVARVKISMGQPGGTTTVLTPTQVGADWTATIEQTYLQNGKHVNVAVQFYDGMKWLTGTKIKIPLQ